MDFDTSVVIKTDRLILRFMRRDDTHDIFNNINHDKDVLKYFIDKFCEDESEMTLEKTIEYCINAKRYLFAIEEKNTHEVIGMILQCSVPDKIFNSSEVGYAIGKKYWNQGYASEAFKAMIDFLFSLGVYKVVASHLIGNDASKRVMEKCGLTYECRRIDDAYYHDKYHDVDYYYIINK